MRRTLRFPVALLVLSIWVAPMAAGLAVGLHLALDPHHRGEHQEAPSTGLAGWAVQGHHHGEVIPEHRHEGVTTARSMLPKILRTASLVAPTSTGVPSGRPWPVAHLGMDRRGPPDGIYRTSCALLL